MQLILLRDDHDPIGLEIPDDSDGSLLYQLVAAEISIPLNAFQLLANGAPVVPNSSLQSQLIVDGTAIFVTPVTRTRGPSYYDIPSNIKPDELLALTKSHPDLLQQFQNQDPELGNVLASGDLPKVRALLMRRFMSHHKKEHEHKQELQAIEADPMNPENQRRIEEAIRLQNIQQNLDAAMENLPESFGRVTMLYVDIEVNKHHVKAFVDSGAQSTIMSVQCAERCGISHLIDSRFAGQARGVGTAKIVGRVHIAQMKFGNSYFPISITVLENNDVDFLFGLDTLRRYRCCIDLDKNVLRIHGVDGVEEIPFLSEGELPENARGTAPDAAPK